MWGEGKEHPVSLTAKYYPFPLYKEMEGAVLVSFVFI
jgi:hypothetical protein